jgi:hypothetical protein
MKYILFLSTMLVLPQVFGAELFVRPDGGTWEQCNGESNTAYSPSVAEKKCAVKHIFELLEPQSQTVRITGGDTINILNNADGAVAEYELGRHDDYINGKCNESWAYDCYMPPVPSGTEENPTRIRGEGWDTGCLTPPSLWGSGRAKYAIRLDGSNNVELSCLEITDHSSCVGAAGFPDTSLRCDRSSPYNKPFADTGLFIADADNVSLNDLTIKGLSTGISAGRLGDVTLTRVHLFANHTAGWNGDISGDDNNTGTIIFDKSAITFSGCALIYAPGTSDHNQPHGCVRQDIGGYGDGLGTGKTGGDWIFQDTKIMYNSSDGLDLLYHELGGKVTVKNSRIEGNGGNQVKVSGNTEIVNNIIISNCGWNSDQEAKLGAEGENCRAFGTALSISWAGPDDAIVLLNNTIVSEGDCILASSDRTKIGQHNQSLYAVNNIFYAAPDYLQSSENSCMYYTVSDFPNRQLHNNIIHQVKAFNKPCENFKANKPDGDNANDGECTSRLRGSYFDNTDYSVPSNPHLSDINLGIQHTAYNLKTIEAESNRATLKDTDSPVYNAGYKASVGGVTIPTTDFYGNPRGSLPDIGAVEYYTPPKSPVILSIEINQ